MAHEVFIRHTYIYTCSTCDKEWKINEALDIEKLSCPHCGKHDAVHYVMTDQRIKYERKWE